MSLIDAIPQTMKEIGRLEGAGVAAKGAARGQSIARLGQIPADIMKFRAEESEMKRREDLVKIQQQQELRQQKEFEQSSQINSMNIEALTKKKEDDAAYGKALSFRDEKGEPDRQKAIEWLNANRPEVLPRYEAAANDAEKTKLDILKNKRDARVAADDSIAEIADAALKMSDDPVKQEQFFSDRLKALSAQGLLDGAEVNAVIAAYTNKDGSPSAAKQKIYLEGLVHVSDKQRKLGIEEAAAKLNTVSTQSIVDKREADLAQTKLATVASQLSNAAMSGKAKYTAAYAGLEKAMRDRFPPPDAFNAKTYPDLARRVGLTADQLSDEANRADMNAARWANVGVARGNLDVRRDSAAAVGGLDSPATKARYKLFEANYYKKNPPPKPDARQSVKDAYKAAPSIDKWYQMEPWQRDKVIDDPNNRITDADMVKRAEARERGDQGGEYKIGDPIVLDDGTRGTFNGYAPNGQLRIIPAR